MIELELMTVLGVLITAIVILGKFIIDKMMQEINKVSDLENKLNLLQQKVEFIELSVKRTEIRNARHITEIAGQLRGLILDITRSVPRVDTRSPMTQEDRYDE